MGKFGWDLPPGCSISDIPGNRPEDEKWEAMIEGFYNGLSKEELEIAETCDELITKAIEYGIEVRIEDEKRIDEENKYYEEQAREYQKVKEVAMSRMGQEFIRMQEAGEIPQGAPVTDMTPVRCSRCHWSGYTPQLSVVYKPDPIRQGDVIPTPGCPACLSDQHLEYYELYHVLQKEDLQHLCHWRDQKQAELEQAVGYIRDIPF